MRIIQTECIPPAKGPQSCQSLSFIWKGVNIIISHKEMIPNPISLPRHTLSQLQGKMGPSQGTDERWDFWLEIEAEQRGILDEEDLG